MATGSSKIPAWRRLGLTLKNEHPSGVAVAESALAEIDLHNTAPYDELESSHGDVQPQQSPAVNGKSSKLGKRKHHHDPAEDHDPTAKRGKKVEGEPKCSRAFATVLATSTEPVRSAGDEAGEAPASEVKQPKGDPNYRKKKEKKPRRKREDREAESQVKSEHDGSRLSPSAVTTSKQQPLLASTETKEIPFSTPQKPRRADSKDSSSSPSGTERRKSVAFTPDTKKVDGSSAQNLFKKWVAEQKSLSGEELSSEVAQPELPIQPAVEEASLDAKVTQETESAAAQPANTTKDAISTGASTGKKKDPSLYTSYLTQYHSDRDNWKFNKAKQNDVINNALSIFRIPTEFSAALLEYVQGLKGAGVVDRLKANCETALKELDEEDAKNPIPMDDPATRQAARDEALERRVKQEKKRRKTEGDIEALSNHPHGEGFIRRLKRERAEALLSALGRAAPILPVAPAAPHYKLQDPAPAARDSRKRKRRVEISSDESSSESSSDEDDSSSESDSDTSDSSDESDSESESDTERPGHQSGSEEDSDSESSGDDDDSESEEGGSDSDSDSESGDEDNGEGDNSDSD